MKFNAILTATLLTAFAAFTAQGRPATVRQVDTQKLPDGTYVPSSFETDVNKMMENWYIKNYTALDAKADQRPATPTPTDQEYIDRLQSLNTVIEMPYNKEVRSFIDMYVNRKKGLVETMLGMSLYYMPIFEEALERYGLPLELKHLPVIESALNPVAVSPAGAAGLWQFMPGTGKDYGLEINSVVDERRDPYKATDAAARYLKDLYNTYKDWTLAIAAYNCGPGNVNKAITRAGGKKDFWEIYRFLPRETRGYVPAFIAANYAMNHYGKHNISPALAARPIVTDTVHVDRRVHFEQISDVLGIPMDELRALNPQYRVDIIPGNVHPYALILPNLQTCNFLANQDSIVNHNAERYAVRDVVEPSLQNKGSDNKGEYVEELVVKYHKVKRGETLQSIARKYGVSQSSIRKANKLGRKGRVQRGKTLRINTYQRRYIEVPDKDPAQAQPDVQDTDTTLDGPAQNDGDTTAAPDQATADEAASQNVTDAEATQAADDKADESAKADEHKAKAETPKAKPERKKDNKPKTVTHTVKSGESLFKIGKKYGVTAQQIKDANGLKSDNIQPGQKLTIPQGKGTTANKSTAKKSKKKSRRRR